MIKLSEEQLNTLETPCLVIDVAQARRNIQKMQRIADMSGCALRPHIKTHKMTLFARMQVEAGAQGITCAKVSEAEVMADAGLDDIFIAYPMVGEFRIRRAIALARRVKRLILAVDSLEGARYLDEAARAAGRVLEVRLEIDTGAGRTGVPESRAPELAGAIHRMQGINLTGIFTFKSLVYQGKPTTDNELAAQEEGEVMARVAEAIRGAGVPIKEISAGSSPTGAALAHTGKVTEIRPGTYIFMDVMLEKEGIATPDDWAVCYVATVVSCQHPEYAVIDGGSKTFATDVPLNTPPGNYAGYAIVEGMPHLHLSRMKEEHGILTAADGETGLSVGDKLILWPIHVCTAVNMHNTVYLLEEGTLRKQRVDARGMLV